MANLDAGLEARQEAAGGSKHLFGIALFPDHAHDTDDMLRVADMALYAA